MNAPDMPPEVRAEAARSVLERAWEKVALTKLFRHNACMKHGVPFLEKEFDLQPPAPAPLPLPAPAPVVLNTPPATCPPAPRLSDHWRTILLSILAALASVAGGYGLAQAISKSPAETETPVVVTEPTSPLLSPENSPGRAHLDPLEYIQRKGGHLP
jgi:hypothetical protein